MMQSAPPVLPRKHSLIRLLKPPGVISPVNGTQTKKISPPTVNAEREVELLNHCFDDVERFMGRLQQAAEARSVLEQRSKKNKKSRRKSKKEKDDDLLTQKATPPAEEEFVDIFQKVKYSLSLLDRLKDSISHPSSGELVHYVFTPLNLMVKTTGGPSLAASVSSPALTSGAVTLLQDTLKEKEKELWMSLGPNWTSTHSQLGEAASPFTPVFLDGWQPALCDADGHPLEDPVESQQRYDTLVESQAAQQEAEIPHQPTEVDSGGLAPDAERLYCCSYDFVARNSSELSVLQGETLEVIESAKRWWKCKNSYDQIGFVPFNILEPLSAVENAEAVQRQQSKKVPIAPPARRFSYSASSPVEASPPGFDGLPAGEGGGDVGVYNDELMQRLVNGRSGSMRPLVIPRATETSAPLDYHSPPAEVQSWLRGKGFSEDTVQSLGILTGAQLFSLNKEELRAVSPEEGVRVYSQITVQKALLEDVRNVTELEEVMEKQKMKVDLKMEAGQL
ncbi:epidermal growth factor receptor kinase substrate 8-like protein 1a isoform X1 [Alosa sapidissima]|uniref:epidermal growth factor receptor kinase substrate 8-like protein 1a isoform X1 n=2 Tax=Alosa sapidissima TaxID=34773 RepID=UPI001C07F9BD|nr:epidermal growth factor receptor kinase substrate 8-like protein 1a isoform X1 [Alosa sapidissima]